MQKWMIAGLALGCLSLGCEQKAGGGLADKMKSQRADEEAAVAEAARKQKEAQAAAIERAKAEAAAEEEARKQALADMPKGNTKTTEEIATTDDEKAIIEELGKPSTFEKVAKKVKKKRKKFEPLLRRALRHGSANVRTQVARIFNINEWKNEEITAAMSEALLEEADDTLRENWGYDFRLYLMMETPKGVEITTDLMPALHKAFKRAKTAGSFSTLAETLMGQKYEPAVADVVAKLKASEDVMQIQFLLAALKRFPHPEFEEMALPYRSHENNLVRLRAKEVMEAVAMAKADAEKAAEGLEKK